jgi:hypothetical protein
MKTMKKYLIGAIMFVATAFMTTPTAALECWTIGFTCAMPPAIICAETLDKALDIHEEIDMKICP